MNELSREILRDAARKIDELLKAPTEVELYESMAEYSHLISDLCAAWHLDMLSIEEAAQLSVEQIGLIRVSIPDIYFGVQGFQVESFPLGKRT